ncbi:GNAT family N-acetyltransferase [Candidatus Acetothermia bacterium]|nr:GNAT family N-acetyltransferase [Candidatus Acetothermia bacterium]
MPVRTRVESLPRLEFHPVTPERWADFEKLFGERGACGGCWCMFQRITRAEFTQQKGEVNKRAMKKLIDSRETPGILAYTKGEPIAWCSIGPRENFLAIERSRILKRVDNQPVWSIVCFFVDKKFRRQGVTVKLLEAAVAHAHKKGAKIVEGYPVEPKMEKMPDVFAWTGFSSAFKKAGFKEVLRRSETRPIMRYVVKK